MDDGLLNGLVGFGQGFLKGMNDAEDRKYKRLEFEAKMKAAEREVMDKKRQQEIELFKSGYDTSGGTDNISGLKFRPDYVATQTGLRQAGAGADPFGNKTKPTEGEFLSGGFAHRAEQAEGVLNQLSSQGFEPGSDRVSFQGMLGGSGLVGRATEGLKDQDVKSYEQAKNNFISAVLRKESGAAISAEEYASEDKKYFPQRGDSPEVIQQKAQARAQAIANLKASSGRAYGRIPSVPAGSNGLIKATIKPAPVSKEDQEAIEWAKKNKKDPRAEAILRANGIQP